MDQFVTVEREINEYFNCLKRQANGEYDGCNSFIPTDEDGKPPGVYCQCGCAMSFHRKGVTKIKEQIEISTAKVIYGECQKNHAVANGGRDYKIDGCVEFKPPGLATAWPGGLATTWPDGLAMVCDACNCHVSFHRRKYVSPQ